MKEGRKEEGRGEGMERVNECTQIHKEGRAPAGQPQLAIYGNPKSKPTASPPEGQYICK